MNKLAMLRRITKAKKMKISQSSKKTQRYFELARRMAKESTYGKLRHGAVLVKGGRVVSVGFNKGSYCAFGQRFRDIHKYGHATQHAEISAILGISAKVTQGASIYVARINNENKFRMSKPCCMCHEVMEFVGVKKVCYTTGEDSYDTASIGLDESFWHRGADD